ncbi:thiosulfate oxidation carrier protein SoxY [Thalassobaculum fulvum]|uniref:Thiosulfate oxidation carrier protein SoxY n=1 Tax=Thalassobaculum fulvum TaxID=1633335 RepID=A0A919CNZ5_9PROT|nr:thiosulfate oxidation carrier protein SoxY [Thalassobaculum fulvum]GHD44673.1 thiosulfate oxidation carrier protein SoxY [Thalassobaculum fulvum]
MKLTRRQALALSFGATTLAVLGVPTTRAWANTEATEKAIKEFTGGAAPEAGRITLDAPEIAENGNTVPISVSVESPMSGDDYVQSVTLLADGNPNPAVATFHFTPLSGTATATTRIRLAKTQNVVAVAKMSNGAVFSDTKLVKVTIGGCGG